jgi:nucleotidyltransferase/DNA polymerase involved in DNA repair
MLTDSDAVLASLDVGEVWGIGRNLKAKLKTMGIRQVPLSGPQAHLGHTVRIFLSKIHDPLRGAADGEDNGLIQNSKLISRTKMS